MQIPDTAPFPEDKKALLGQLLPGITPGQIQWLSGFLAGLQSAMHQPAATPSLPAGSPPHRTAPSVTILYGSESGNAFSLAQETQRFATQRGYRATLKDMEGLSVADLARETLLLVITSTWGEGDPPVNAVDLYTSLMGAGSTRLDNVRFSVCALGDTSYERFCQTGRDFDRRLQELGAVRLHPRTDCDLDYETPFRAWLQAVFERMDQTVASRVASTPQLPGFAPSASTASAYGKSHPFPAPLKEKILLSGRGSLKEVWHMEFSLASSGLLFDPGDSLGVVPSNAPDIVEALLKAGNFRESSVPGDEGNSVPLFDALQHSYDITTLSRPLLAKFNEIARSAKLERLLEDASSLKSYLHGRHVVDLLEEFPVPNLSANQFIKLLRKLPPRLYSIASSRLAYPDEVHLTVAAVRFESHGRARKGVASTCLADIVETGCATPVYVAPNRHFKLPADPSAPVIMIGPGTGVAPFRAFVQERRATGATGKNWLFFGDHHYTTDFLYQLEWQDALKDGSLTCLDVAFSRDQKDKIYVQHRMEERGALLWSWLEEGASIYVCGNASHMAPDVHETLARIVSIHGQRSREEADAYLEQLRKTKRYQRDVY